jgi:hypothetical protein
MKGKWRSPSLIRATGAERCDSGLVGTPMLGVILLLQLPHTTEPHLWIERAPNQLDHMPFRPGFGSAVADLGDVNGDGVPDFVIADVRPECNGMWGDISAPPCDEAAWIISGRDGKMLARVDGPSSKDRFGFSSVGLGDLDHDGCSDWAAGWGQSVHGDDGRLDVYSGKSAKRLFSLTGPNGFARHVADAGDIDGDGHDDLIVSGDVKSDVKSEGVVLATILSSATGKVLERFAVEEPGERLVAPPVFFDSTGSEGGSRSVAFLTVAGDEAHARLRLVALRDQTKLGSTNLPAEARRMGCCASRFSLGRWRLRASENEPACLVSSADGEVWAVSPSKGTVTVLRKVDSELEIVGVGVAITSSIDDDEVPDYWIGTYGFGGTDCILRAISGADGRAIRTTGTYDDLCKLDVDPIGCSLATVGDVDADGVSDVVVGTSYLFGSQQGAAFLVSGKSGRVIFGVVRKGQGVSVIHP